MKRVRYAFALALILTCAAMLQAQSVEAVVNRYIGAATGGQSFDTIQSMRMVMSGELGAMGNMSNMMQGQEMKYTMYVMKPNKFHMDMKIGPMSMVMASDGEDSWMSMMGRTMNMPGGQGQGFGNMAEMYQGDYAKYFKDATYVGAESFADGEACQVLKVTPEGGNETMMYFSDNTGLLHGMLMNSGGNDMTVTLGDYRDVNGFKMPFLYSVTAGDKKMMDLIIEELQINPEIDEGMFKRP